MIHFWLLISSELSYLERKVFSRLLLSLVLFLGLSACSDKQLFSNLDNNELTVMLDKGVPMFDIRRSEEWKQTGVVEGSKKLTFVDKNGRLTPEFLPKFTSAVGKDEPVILICRTGNRTRALASHLTQELGYTNVHHVKNGITNWIRDGRSVVKN